MISFEFTDEEMAGILSLTSMGCVDIARNYMNIEENKEIWLLELDNIEKESENQILRLINAKAYDDVLDKIEKMRGDWIADLKSRGIADDTEKAPTDEDEEVNAG